MSQTPPKVLQALASWGPRNMEAWMERKGTTNTLCGYGPKWTAGAGDLHDGGTCEDCLATSTLLLTADLEAFGDLRGPPVEMATFAGLAT